MSNNHELHFESIQKNEDVLNKVKQIYDLSFPENEKIPFEFLIRASQSESFHFNALMDGDDAVGLMVFLNDETYLYLFFFAIDGSIRSCGYGSKAIQLLKDTYKDLTIFGSVEIPDETSSNYEQRVSRIKFYERNGIYCTDNYLNTSQGEFLEISSDKNLDIVAAVDTFARVMSAILNVPFEKVRSQMKTRKKIN